MSAEAMPSPHPQIHVERDHYVAVVTIDRPESKNGCTGDMWVSLGEVFRRLPYTGARVVLLTGAGGNFCSGADLSGLAASGSSEAGESASILDGMRVLGDVVMAIHGCPVPVVAKVDGLCVGAGLGLALAADLTWCADRARFSAIFAKRGLSLDFGTSWLLRQRIGAHKAKELAFTAKIINGVEAHALGLVNAVVPADDLDAAVNEVVEAIAAGPPRALSMTKREIDNAGTSSLAQALEIEALAQSVNVTTEDMREAMIAYVERRTPQFKGR
jgi:2-(1,2-epoxy-1,2-dihydrophenyl)acetyl-CoA isomerase